jgi:putative ABC transport system permease protein
MMIESGLLATLGCIGGILIAATGIKYLPSLLMNNGEMRWIQFIELNSHVLAISVGCGFLTTLLFGFLPALINSRVNLNDALKQGGRSSETKTAGRWRSFLIVLEVAMAFVLLTSASLLLQSFNRLSQLDPGFNPEKLSFMQIVLMGDRYKTPEQRSVFINNLHTRLTTLPGVESVGITSVRPFVAAGAWGAFAVESRVPVLHSEWPEFTLYPVSPDYLKTMGIRLLRGRTITHGDTPSKTPAILINESTARKYFPDEEPIGRYLILDGPTFVGAPGTETKCEIVGVVGDVVQESFDAKSRPQIYTSLAQCTPPGLCFVLRTANDPASLLLAARQQVYAIDKDQSIREQKLFTQSLDERLSQRRFQVFLLGAFAVVTLLITVIGIYGVIAFSVSRRTYEIGIRLALGAQTKTILHMILNQGMRLIACGLGLGLAASPLLLRLLQPYLFQTKAYDPVNMLAVAGVLSLAALIACWRPARRAMHVDPINALRAE